MINNGIEVQLKPDAQNIKGNNFLTIKETLSRMGQADFDTKLLIQECHILHKQSRYFILHYKEFFELENGVRNYSDIDLEKRDSICYCLKKWGHINFIDKPEKARPINTLGISVIKYADKNDWIFETKYQVGK